MTKKKGFRRSVGPAALEGTARPVRPHTETLSISQIQAITARLTGRPLPRALAWERNLRVPNEASQAERDQDCYDTRVHHDPWTSYAQPPGAPEQLPDLVHNFAHGHVFQPFGFFFGLLVSNDRFREAVVAAM
jgi:hypothetical protein